MRPSLTLATMLILAPIGAASAQPIEIVGQAPARATERAPTTCTTLDGPASDIRVECVVGRAGASPLRMTIEAEAVGPPCEAARQVVRLGVSRDPRAGSPPRVVQTSVARCRG